MGFWNIIIFGIARLSLGEHAYLDPGSGSFLLQLLIAGLLGAGFVIRRYWSKITSLFSRSKSEEDDDTDAQHVDSHADHL